ncbi:Ral GTPase-activating protein subunit alpha/beta N-terminal domain-containing protein [Caenorhabditis elegans]|nr:Ral GTPase-activating protein subunit alpha/beta N-terminal domain-containing protein [Caenorhabditis elegans]SFQ94274.1 Ral GTPase-activating protein subunit alpha/beta N-terminal domain-containing protein [Caenorhabditis elegans]|eukprot:NP_001334205.1 Heterodimeric GTPase Activating Protein subunit [Caenorhabditis elegans]
MYEQWPTLEFSDLNSSILDLFTKATSQSVASSLLYELTRSDADENGGSIRLNNEEHLKWCMQVLNHSLTLSFATSREYETLKGAVRIYLHWLRALCDTPDNNIPTPLLATPEKYFRNIIDALRWIFCRREDDFDTTVGGQVPRGLAIERQSIEIDMVLDSLKYLTRNSSRKYQDEVWARSISFLLNSSDILLSEPNATEEMGTRTCVRVADTLFDMWLNAVLNEHIPSLTYWSSLATLARRWRHNVPIIECWAKKILGLSTLVCRKMYGDDFLKIDIVDESVLPFENVPMTAEEDENEVHLLYRTWFNMLCLFDSPAKILNHDATRNLCLNGNSPRRTTSSISMSNFELASSSAAQGVSFFLAAVTLQRMVDLFYGDSRVKIDLRNYPVPDGKTAPNTRTASVLTDNHSHHTNRTSSTTGDSSRYVSLGGAVGQIIVDDHQVSMSSGSTASGKTSTATGTSSTHTISSEIRRDQRIMSVNDRSRDPSHRTVSVTDSVNISNQSRYSEQTSSTLTYKSAPIPETANENGHGESISQLVSNSTVSAPVGGAGNDLTLKAGVHPSEMKIGRSSGVIGSAQHNNFYADTTSPYRSAQRFVTNFLTANQATMPYVGGKRPKTDRMLNLVGDWLFAIVNSPTNSPRVTGNDHSGHHKKNNDGVSDDVISGLSLHSVDLDDIPDAMSPMMGRSDSNAVLSGGHNAVGRRKSVGSSCSSVAGESDVMSSTSTAGGHSQKHPEDYQQVDGVTAGRAAALASLIRIITSKSSNEKIPNSQLSNFYATVFQCLVEKERVMLCTLFYYGRNLFRLGLPGIESLLPHFLFALDIVMIESSKLRLHPSISEVEVRRACLRALSSVICWPTTFGMSKIPQIAEAANLKSNAATYLHLRSRIFKTLMFSVRNETDPTNLHIALSLCAVLVEESCQFDLGLNEEQTKEMIRISTTASSSGQPEKGLCASIVRGVLSAICDKFGRIETIDHSTALAIIDVLNCISHVHHTVLFNNMDVSTGTLVIASLCRFIEQQLNKPPPMHSKDLHSTVVAAYNAVAVWLTASPLLAECVGVLGTVCDVIQLGVTGSKTSPDLQKSRGETVKPKAASQRVLEAAEALMYTLFCVVGRKPGPLRDEKRLVHKYGPNRINTSKFLHVLVNGDTLLSLHEASHIDDIPSDSASVVYVRRSPMQGANTGIARLRPKPENYHPEVGIPPMTPMSAASTTEGFEGPNTPKVQKSIGEQFVIPPEFYKNSCKLDNAFRNLESTTETEAIAEEMKQQNSQNGRSFFDESRRNNVFERMRPEERIVAPSKPLDTCSSIRMMLYDFGLINERIFGSEIVLLDSSMSEKFYRDLHETVDCAPARTQLTAHIFYVKEGQRIAVDILENALNVQNSCSDFCMFLANLGEGIEIGVHDTWTGHWSTAYSTERKLQEEADGVDHYIVDGIQHALWWCDEQGSNSELAFLMPTERSVRMFKQNITSPASSSRRGSNNNRSIVSDDKSFDSTHTDNGMMLNARRLGEKSPSNLSDRDFRPYAGGGSSMGHGSVGRRTGALKIMLVWLERPEDMTSFPIYELIGTCDDGTDLLNGGAQKPEIGGATNSQVAHHIIFIHLVEPGIVQIRTRGTVNRFGEAGPLVDGVVVSLANLPSFIRNTILNTSRRDVAEIENYTFPHTRRKQAIVEFAKKYAAKTSYEEFLVNVIQN